MKQEYVAMEPTVLLVISTIPFKGLSSVEQIPVQILRREIQYACEIIIAKS